MTRLLVIGAGGFLGRHVAAAARTEPGVAAVLTPPRSDLDLDRGVDHVRGVLDRTRPDAVLLCTGRLDGTVSELTEAHVGALAVLLDALLAVGRPVRLVRLGSAGEYGPVPVGRAVTEDHPTAPVTAYGASHLAATQLLLTVTRQGPVSGTTLRVFNPVGAGGHGPSLVSQTAHRIRAAMLDGADEIVTGPLTTWRDLVDADDVARAAVAAALAPVAPPPVLNVGSGHAVCTREVVDTLCAVAGWHGRVREDAAPPQRSAGVTWIQADISRARQALGWKPRRPLSDSLRQVWAETDHDLSPLARNAS